MGACVTPELLTEAMLEMNCSMRQDRGAMVSTLLHHPTSRQLNPAAMLALPAALTGRETRSAVEALMVVALMFHPAARGLAHLAGLRVHGLPQVQGTQRAAVLQAFHLQDSDDIVQTELPESLPAGALNRSTLVLAASCLMREEGRWHGLEQTVALLAMRQVRAGASGMKLVERQCLNRLPVVWQRIQQALPTANWRLRRGVVLHRRRQRTALVETDL